MSLTRKQANRAYLKMKRKVLGNETFDPPTLRNVFPAFVRAKQRLIELCKGESAQ